MKSATSPTEPVNQPVLTCNIDTVMGTFTAMVSQHGVVALWFPLNPHAPSPDETLPPNRPALKNAYSHFMHLEKELKAYLTGRLTALTVHIDEATLANHPVATDFRFQVWQKIRKVGYGDTITYGELAQMCGGKNKARAVGSACGANPVPVLIPCHRIVAANGIGGFSGRLEYKQFLLELESQHRRNG